MTFITRLIIYSSHNQSIFTTPICRFRFCKKIISYFPRKAHLHNLSQAEKDEASLHLQYCASLLQHSGHLKDIRRGNLLHSTFIKTGLKTDVFIQNNLLQMYANCGELLGARAVFDEIPEPNLVSWTSMISTCIQHGYADLGLELFSLMCHSGLQPNEFGFSSALKACRTIGDFSMGKLLHGFIIKCGLEFYVFCSTSILDLYVKRGNLSDAHKYFNGIPFKCEALWNTLIDGHAKSSEISMAVELFRKMLLSDIRPSCFTYTILIKMCSDVVDFYLGRCFHGQTIKTGLEKYNFVGGALVDLCAKWGALDDACRVFWSLEDRDNVIWSTLLSGYHQSGEPERGLNLFLEFVSEGYKIDQFMFASAFNLCSDLATPLLGLQVQCWFVKSGFVLDSFVGSTIIDMYSSFGMIHDAYKSFIDVRDKSEMCFNAMISSFVYDSDDINAINLFLGMRQLGVMPNCSTLNYILGAYANLVMLEGIKTVHSHILKTLGETNSNTGVPLIEMYAQFKEVDDAFEVFSGMNTCDEYTWTIMMSAYNELQRYGQVLELFHGMHSSRISKPSKYTLVVVIQACSRLGSLSKALQIHDYIIKSGFESYAFIGSALIGMYAKCSSIEDASAVFSNMPERDLVSWNSMITAYTQHGNGEEALRLFSEIQHGCLAIDESIVASCLSACASLVTLEKGKWVHSSSIRAGFESHLHVGCAIIDMYCKCGSIEDARKFFNKMREHNAVSWTAMVCGYAKHGYGIEALELFEQMEDTGEEPDGVTFIGVLSACSHVGLVKEGWHYFKIMGSKYGLNRTINHYACMVDILGRAGQIEEAETLIKGAPFESIAFLWKTLLGACNKHGNVEVGNRVAQMLVNAEPNEPSNYVLLSNMYASASMWDHSMEMRNKMKEASMNKNPGCSMIELLTA